MERKIRRAINAIKEIGRDMDDNDFLHFLDMVAWELVAEQERLSGSPDSDD